MRNVRYFRCTHTRKEKHFSALQPNVKDHTVHYGCGAQISEQPDKAVTSEVLGGGAERWRDLV